MPSPASQPGLCLVAEARGGPAWIARLSALLDAALPATLILVRPAGAAEFDIAATRTLVEMAQKKRIAAILADAVEAARTTGADGVHLSWRPEVEDAYEAARSQLGASAIIGVDAGISRHDAMTLGEAAADYVAFGRSPDVHGTDANEADAFETQHALVTWWSEIFVIPVVAFDAETADDVRAIVAAGADFVAVRMPADATPEADLAWARDLRAALERPANAA